MDADLRVKAEVVQHHGDEGMESADIDAAGALAVGEDEVQGSGRSNQ